MVEGKGGDLQEVLLLEWHQHESGFGDQFESGAQIRPQTQFSEGHFHSDFPQGRVAYVVVLG